MTLSEYIIEAVAKRRSGKYKNGITSEMDPNEVVNIFNENHFREVDGHILVHWMNMTADSSGTPVFKLRSYSDEKCVYLSVPGGLAYVLTYLPKGNDWLLAGINRIDNGKVDRRTEESTNLCIDEINEFLK